MRALGKLKISIFIFLALSLNSRGWNPSPTLGHCRGESSGSPRGLILSMRPGQSVYKYGPGRGPIYLQEASRRPVIDGSLRDLCWRTSEKLSGFVKDLPGNLPAEMQTEVYFTFDASNLYLAVRCIEDAPEKLVKEVTREERDGNVWGDDCLDMFISPDRKTIYQFLTNSLGAKCDFKAGEKSWDADWEVVTRVADDAWTAEIEIPLQALGIEKMERGKQLTFNIGRRRRHAGELSSLFAGYSNPGQFGTLVLGSKEDYLRLISRRKEAAQLSMEVYLDREEYDLFDYKALAQIVLRAEKTAEAAGIAHHLIISLFNAEGALLAKQEEEIPGEVIDLELDISDLRPGRYEFRFDIANKDRKVRASAPKDFRIVEPPSADIIGKKKRVLLRTTSGKGIERKKWPLKLGVPFPKGALNEPEMVRLVDKDGKQIPCQTQEMARWGEAGSIKWLLLDFQAPVEKDEEGTYFLEYGRPSEREPDVALQVLDEPQTITVDTGRIKFVVSKKRFVLFEQAWLDINGDGKYSKEEALLKPEALSGPYIIDHRGKKYWAALDLRPTVKIEEVGKLRLAIRATGWHISEEGERLCLFLVRIHAYAGQPFVRVFHTFIITADTGEVRYRDIGLQIPVLGRNYAFGTKESVSGSVQEGAPTYLLQQTDEHYKIITPEAQIEGDKAEGWVDLKDGRKGLTVAIRHFWQQYPKELEVGADKIITHFWPAHNEEPRYLVEKIDIKEAGHLWFVHEGKELNFRVPDEYKTRPEWQKELHVEDATPGIPNCSVVNAMGLAKTHEMLFYFHPGGAEEAASDRLNAIFQEKPIATIDPEWFCQSRVFGYLHPYDPGHFPEAERLISDAAEALFRRQALFRDYGMFNFGDTHHNWIAQENRWSLHRHWYNTHHGMPRWPWILYGRSADPKYYRWGETNARHVLDVDHCHYTTKKFIGLPWPQGKTLGGLCDYKGLAHWSSGARCAYNSVADFMLWYYYVTGDRRGLDVALEHGIALKTHPRPTYHREGSGRVTSLVALYEHTWDNTYLEMIEKHMERLLESQREDGSYPQWENFAPFLQRYIDLTGNERARRSIARWCDSYIKRSTPWQTGTQAYYNIFAYAYFATSDPRYIAYGKGQLRLLNERPFEGQSPFYQGEIVGSGHLTTSYLCQTLPYFLEALSRARPGIEPLYPTRHTLRYVQYERINDKRIHKAEVCLGDMEDAAFVISLKMSNIRGAAVARLLDPAGKAIWQNEVAKGSDVSFEIDVPKDGLKGTYRLRIEGDGEFSIQVPLTALDSPIKEVYRIPRAGVGLYLGFRGFFMVPEGVEAFKVPLEGRVWGQTASLFAPDGKRVARLTWAGQESPGRKFLQAEVQEGYKGRPWELISHMHHAGSLLPFEAVKEGVRIPPYFAVVPEKLYWP